MSGPCDAVAPLCEPDLVAATTQPWSLPRQWRHLAARVSGSEYLQTREPDGATPHAADAAPSGIYTRWFYPSGRIASRAPQACPYRLGLYER